MGGLPVVDEGWHAMFQAIRRGVEGAEWEVNVHKFGKMHQEVNVRHPSGGQQDYDAFGSEGRQTQRYAMNIERREGVRQELWTAHPQSPTIALSQALRRADVWHNAGSSGAGCGQPQKDNEG